MEKRVKQISKCVQEKLGSERNYLIDRISQLPDEILVSITSKLRLREALRTSVISKRWKNIWTFTSGSLDFDDFMAKWRVEENPKAKHSIYAEWVNKVLELHQSSTIDEFRVCFVSDASYECMIDKWIEFAIAKKAQCFELDFTRCWDSGWKATCWNPNLKAAKKYTFPQAYANIQSPHGLSSIKSMRSISLKFVNIRGEILEFLLSSCPLLEKLHVEHSDHLLSLNVAGSSLRLKYLEIILCANLKTIEISAPQLVLFHYYGGSIKLHIHSAPLLVNVSFRMLHPESITYAYHVLASYLSQLETLRLEFWMNKVQMQFVQCELACLTHLMLTVFANDSVSLLGFSSMINGSPFLHKFTLKVEWQVAKWKMPLKRKIQTAPKCSHQHLKIVELDGFSGLPIDFELLIYLLENAVILEKVIIKPNYIHPSKSWPKRVVFMEEAVRELQKKVPQKVELIVL